MINESKKKQNATKSIMKRNCAVINSIMNWTRIGVEIKVASKLQYL